MVLCWRTLLLLLRRLLRRLLLLLLVVLTGTTHDGHRLATAAARRGWCWRESTEGLSALGEVLGGALDFCGDVLAEFVAHVKKRAPAMCWHRWQPPSTGLTPSTSTAHYHVPSNCATKALASSLFTVELAPGSMLLGVLPRLYALCPVPEREGGCGCSHDGWRPGAGAGQEGSL